MGDNKYSWNETLKFSWGHIIAFVALIFISYVSYMGVFYSNGGDFKSAAIKVFLIDIFLIISFIGAQIIKGTDEKFDRSIIIERILISLCPIAFLWAMLPYNHFWSVYSDKDQIEPKFTSAIEKSRQMFSDYDYYSKSRILSYSETLSKITANKVNDRATYLRAGFNFSDDEVTIESYLVTLRLQLLSQNIDSLKTMALKWINDANQGASVWNAFLVGNIDMINEAIEEWNQKLYEVSLPVLSNEQIYSDIIIKPFDQNKSSFKAANKELESLKDLFVNNNGITLYTIVTGFLLFLMLMFPYFLQRRNEKAKGYYSLFSKSKTDNIKKHINNDDVNEKSFDNTSFSQNTFSDDIYGGTF